MAGRSGEGALDGFAIACPRHGAKFDVRDWRGPDHAGHQADRDVHEVKVEGDEVLVQLSD